jgi:hypothetical protein
MAAPDSVERDAYVQRVVVSAPTQVGPNQLEVLLAAAYNAGYSRGRVVLGEEVRRLIGFDR